MGSGQSKRQPIPEEECKKIWASVKLTWTNEELKEQRESILTPPKYTSSGKPMKLKILIFGPIGAGKSSFLNGILSAIEDRKVVSNYFPVAKKDRTVTKGFHGTKIGGMWLIDMGGIFPSESITDDNIKDIASGKIPFYTKMTEHLAVKDRVEYRVPASGKNDVACVIIVLKPGEISEDIKRQLGCIVDLASEGVVSYRLVVTHVDTTDPDFIDPSNLPSVFESKAVQEKVFAISEQTGISPGNISVVRNYRYGQCTDLHSNILFLNALELAVSSAKDQAQKRAFEQELMQELIGADAAGDGYAPN